jgi:hypothetical protein
MTVGNVDDRRCPWTGTRPSPDRTLLTTVAPPSGVLSMLSAEALNMLNTLHFRFAVVCGRLHRGARTPARTSSGSAGRDRCSSTKPAVSSGGSTRGYCSLGRI